MDDGQDDPDFEKIDEEVSEALVDEDKKSANHQHTSHMQVDHAPNDNLSNSILSISHLLVTLDGIKNEDIRNAGLESLQCFMRAVVSPAKTAIFPFVKE